MKNIASHLHLGPVSPLQFPLLVLPAALVLAVLQMWAVAVLIVAAWVGLILVPGARPRRVDRALVAFSAVGAVVVLFVLLPVANLVAITPVSDLTATAGERTVQNALWLTMSAALTATAVSLLFGVPLAYVLARERFVGKAVVEGIIDIPVVIPHTVAGIALLFIFGQRAGVLGRPLAENMDILIADTYWGIVVAMLFVSVPFIVNQARDGFQRVDPRLENVARTLGSTRMGAFTRVTLPLTWRALLSGSIMSWARAISEFGSIAVIAYFPLSATTLIYERYQAFGLSGAKPVATLMILVSLTIFIALRGISSIRRTERC